jgi:hypothetical protein
MLFVRQIPEIDIKRADGTPLWLPARLYKFMKPEHANALLQWGSVRVGTLYEYRNEEKHSGGVVDPGEGTLTHIERVEEAKANQLTEYSRRLTTPTSGVTLSDVTIETHHEIPDRYIYCASLSPSWDADIHGDYTACVEILDVSRFSSGLWQLLSKRNLLTGSADAFPVVYAGRTHSTTSLLGEHCGGVPAGIAYLKPERFANQKEFRISFEPRSFPVEPVIGRFPRLGGTCRLHSVRP